MAIFHRIFGREAQNAAAQASILANMASVGQVQQKPLFGSPEMGSPIANVSYLKAENGFVAVVMRFHPNSYTNDVRLIVAENLKDLQDRVLADMVAEKLEK